MVKKWFLIFVFCTLSPLQAVKVLHIAFHKGCINDFNEVAQELNFDLTSWFVQDKSFPQTYDPLTTGNAIYNVSHERAERVWHSNKDFFDQFDVIVTSDTAPLSRIFLQNGWQKPLIIWVCNRFDYYDAGTRDGKFPDQEYYDLFKQATQMPNVRVVAYTPYEAVYAAKRDIDIFKYTIKPLGAKPIHQKDDFTSAIPSTIDKSATIFITPRLSSAGLSFVQRNCAAQGIATYSGVYNGPYDLKDFKGILQFPYAWSNLALFENIQYGMIHFVPSMTFLKKLALENAPIPYPGFSKSFVHGEEWKVCEWYLSEHENLFVYFDSWKDLEQKIADLDSVSHKERILEFGYKHRKTMLTRWQELFDDLLQYTYSTGAKSSLERSSS